MQDQWQQPPNPAGSWQQAPSAPQPQAGFGSPGQGAPAFGPASSPPEAWYAQPVVLVLALVFCWPVGLALLWVNRRVSTMAKAGVTAAFAVLVLGAVAAGAVRSRQGAASGPRPSPPAAAAPLVFAPAVPDCPSGTRLTEGVDSRTGAATFACVATLPRYTVVDDTPLPPFRKGHRVQANVADPDITDAQCAAVVAELRPRAAPDGQVSVHVPLHSDRSKVFPLCFDNLDGTGVHEGTARAMQRAYDKGKPGH